MAPTITGNLRIVMLGMTGAGKSATGNTILGREEFKEDNCPESVTQQSEKKITGIGTRTLSIIDTPGLQDTSTNEHEVKAEIKKCMRMSAPGPHVFLLVIRVDVRLTEEVMHTVKWIQENFGENAARHTIIVFTHADSLHRPLKEHIEESQDLRQFVMTCGGRYHAFNNEDRKNESQVKELVEKMDELVISNEGRHYTNEMLNEAQRRLNWRKPCAITIGVCIIVIAVVVKKCKK